MMGVVELDRVEPQPWRNGGGITRELLAWPDGAAWQLRISVADVTRDGPFSAYPGVERWFTVLQGAGVVLHFGDDDLRLVQESPPLRFDGAAAPDCTLIDGATRDLNLFARHAAGHGEMQSVAAGVAWQDSAPLRAVFTLHAAELRVEGLPAAALPARALAWSETAAGQRWELVPDESPPRAWWLSFTPQHP
jgi:environmental stress-induced protein Ves